MAYWLCSNGGLLEGADEEAALQAIMRLSKLPEEKARQAFLSGKRRRIKQAETRETLDKVVAYLRKAGVDVFVLEQAEKPTTAAVSQTPDEPKEAETLKPSVAPSQTVAQSSPSRRGQWMALASVLLVALLGLGGYAWYWLYGSVSERLLIAENALADGSALAIGQIDVAKSVLLYDGFIGEMDPQALPIPEKHEGLYQQLFSGPANLRDNLHQIVFSITEGPQSAPKKVVTNFVLAGSFNMEAMITTLKSSYEITVLQGGRWKLVEKKSLSQDGEIQPAVICEKQEGGKKRKQRPPKTAYLFADQQWILMSSSEEVAAGLWQRLQEQAEAVQSLETWLSYRAGKLAAFMAFVPQQAAQSLDGIARMMAQGAAQQAPNVKGVGLGATVTLPASVTFNGTLLSDNASWNNEIVTQGQSVLDEALAESVALSPSMNKLFSRINLKADDTQVTADVAFDHALLTEINSVIEETMTSLFSLGMSSSDDEVGEERIDENPTDYSIYNGITALPDVQTKEHETTIYRDGAFGVRLNAFRSTNFDAMTLRVEGMVGLPEGRAFNASRIESAAFHIEEVADKEGRSLLRDEHCLTKKEFFGDANHEKATQFSIMNERASIIKELRLNENTKLQDLHRIKGWIEFSVPTQVTKFSLEAKPGALVEHRGVRVYLNRVKGGSLRYQVSGDHKRVVEVRGLNAAGQALSGAWSTNQGGKGTVSQSFRGEVKSVEVYVAEAFLNEKKAFDIVEPLSLAVHSEKRKVKPFELVPKAINTKLWKKYEKLDWSGLTFSKDDWWGAPSSKPVSEGITFSAAKMFLFHTPDSWSASPQVGLYLPVLTGFPSVLSALSSTVEIPAANQPGAVYHRIHYPYYSDSKKLAVKREHQGMKVAVKGFSLNAKIEQGQKLDRVKGEVTLRIPLSMSKTKLSLASLWKGVETDGVKVTLKEISWGMFPGYSLKVEGAIDRLVNVHGVLKDGKRIAADPINFQSAGHWTMTLPQTEGMQEIELILAKKQKIINMPFDVTPTYH